MCREAQPAQLALYHDGKNHAVASLRRDDSTAKVSGHRPALASANIYLLYCRAVRQNENLCS
jgi:hypothetical protein